MLDEGVLQLEAGVVGAQVDAHAAHPVGPGRSSPNGPLCAAGRGRTVDRMSESYLPPFSGSVPHPPGYVCGDLCTPACVQTATPAADASAVPAPREALEPAAAPR